MAAGTLAIDPDAPRPDIRLIAYGADGVVERPLADPGEIPALLGAHAVLWVNVDGVGDETTVAALGEAFGLHPLALADAVHVHQRAKVEPYPQHLFVVCRMIAPGPALDSEQLALFLGDRFVLTVQEKPGGDCLDPVRERIRKGGAIRAGGPDHLAHAILDAVIDQYFPALEALGERLEAIESAVIASPHPDHVMRMHRIRRDLLGLRRAVWPLRDALASLVREPGPRIGEETRLYLRDCQDHVVQAIDLAENYRELAASLTDAYLSSVSNRMNEVMKVLTLIATLFIPLTFVTSLYGMNFDPDSSPLNMPELRWRFGYPLALGVMALTTVGLVAYFRRKGWLGPRARTRPGRDDTP